MQFIIQFTSLTIVKTILNQDTTHYSVNILIDGLNDRDLDQVRKEIKKWKISYKRIKGLKDEQEILLRLADSITGFLRDWTEKQKYTLRLYKKFRQENIISEV